MKLLKNSRLVGAVALAVVVGEVRTARGQSTNAGSAATNEATAEISTEKQANTAWRELQRAAIPPPSPLSWETNAPSEEELKHFHRVKGGMAAMVAEKAHDFYTRFPKDRRAQEARDLEYNLLRQSVLLGYADATARFEQLEDAKLGDKNLGEAGRFEIVMARERRRLSSGQFTNRLEYAAALERAGHELTAGFPDHPEGFALLLNAAASSEPAKGRALIQEVLASANTNTNVAALKESAEGLLRRMGLIGQPLKLEFTALDGREVDTTNLKGKVVLVDFWATWCGPCVALVPELKGLYDKYHERGLEIVGMDMDVNKESVENFVQDRGIPWPQFFDTSGPINHYAQEFAVEAIPQVWLIDKKGVLRDMEGRMDLESKLEGLLAE